MVENRKVGPRSGFVKATFSVTPRQLEAVLATAKMRAKEAGRFRPDASEALREVLEGWMKQRGEG